MWNSAEFIKTVYVYKKADIVIYSKLSKKHEYNCNVTCTIHGY